MLVSDKMDIRLSDSCSGNSSKAMPASSSGVVIVARGAISCFVPRVVVVVENVHDRGLKSGGSRVV
jgi:hypothetical protein